MSPHQHLSRRPSKRDRLFGYVFLSLVCKTTRVLTSGTGCSPYFTSLERFVAKLTEGWIYHRPSELDISSSQIAKFRNYLENVLQLHFGDYDDLHSYSVTKLESFWIHWWSYYLERGGQKGSIPNTLFDDPSKVLTSRTIEEAKWFPTGELKLNYAEVALGRANPKEAVVQVDENGRRTSMSRDELTRLVAITVSYLKDMGVGVNDVVCGYVPNTIFALVGLLATATIGAIWSSCSPEFGPTAVLDRFAQLSPKVLLGVDGYWFNGRYHSRERELNEIVSGLTSLQGLLVRSAGEVSFAKANSSQISRIDEFEDLVKNAEHVDELEFVSRDFSDPLWVLFSSGTTGLPKGIVQSHGGICFEHSKILSLHLDLKEDSKFFWYTTTGWMMWNFLVSGLLVGSTVVLYDGSPTFGTVDHIFELCDREEVTFLGTSAPYLAACMKSCVDLFRKYPFNRLSSIGSTGAPLTGDVYEWVYRQFPSSLSLVSASGGTDLCTAFLGSSPLHEIREGELSCATLGADVAVFNSSGEQVRDEVGELVILSPMPSMPLYFWNDADGSRMHEAYFSTFKDVWRHGDWAKQRTDGGYVLYGRSDATLNRGGVRMGTAEFYAVVEKLPAVADSLVVDTSGTTPIGKLVLFVQLQAGLTLNDDLKEEINTTIRHSLSPRHVPDVIVAVPGIPKTINGKKMEVPIRRAFSGSLLNQLVSAGSMSNPETLEPMQAAIESLRAN